ncbi:putative PH domain protein [Trypoxylus dichotomus]
MNFPLKYFRLIEKGMQVRRWLTKSPPTKRLWRGRWRRRWFALHPGDLPQQYILAYYTDRNCRKSKGVIDLDNCDQVDIGFKFEDKKVKFDYMFAIKTQPRTYYLAADTEAELKSWVKCICDVCGLKATNEDDDGIQFIEEKPQSTTPIEIHNTLQQKHILESPPVSPVSASPYIPISECITGKSPIFLKDHVFSKRLLQGSCEPPHFINNQNHSNATYETPTYLNCAYPAPYEIPRGLLPHRSTKSINKEESSNRKNSLSPLQSPAGSDSVFTDENWSNDTVFKQSSRNFKTSSSLEDVGIAEKFTKIQVDSNTSEDFPQVPPRPPKPAHINQGSSNYFNISTQPSLIKLSKNLTNCDDSQSHIASDDMYDFPRSHQVEADSSQSSVTKRHCYNNAAPVMCPDGQVFKYDMSPQAGTSNQQVFVYEMDDMSDVPPSPSSQNSSVYYNLSSPFLPDTQLIAPPVVNRGLKPKRKLSDTLSVSSNPEPSSPRLAPSVDRKLKPTTTALPKLSHVQSSHGEPQGNLRKMFNVDVDTIHKMRTRPSPIPTILRRSHDSLVSDNEQVYLLSTADSLQNYHKLEYLDLDLDNKTSQFSSSKVAQPLRSPGANTAVRRVFGHARVRSILLHARLENSIRMCTKCATLTHKMCVGDNALILPIATPYYSTYIGRGADDDYKLLEIWRDASPRYNEEVSNNCVCYFRRSDVGGM